MSSAVDPRSAHPAEKQPLHEEPDWLDQGERLDRGSFDLFEKKALYERYGVQEYVLVLAREPQVLWFVHRDEEFEELAPGGDGLFRSEVFPGLWLDPNALLQHDSARVRAALEQGLATAEHADFVQRLQEPQPG